MKMNTETLKDIAAASVLVYVAAVGIWVGIWYLFFHDLILEQPLAFWFYADRVLTIIGLLWVLWQCMVMFVWAINRWADRYSRKMFGEE
jgi:hypothetical protein